MTSETTAVIRVSAVGVARAVVKGTMAADPSRCGAVLIPRGQPPGSAPGGGARPRQRGAGGGQSAARRGGRFRPRVRGRRNRLTVER
ncbi:hypothetical protein GCM10010417_13980 [Streptomyces carpaticus]